MAKLPGTDFKKIKAKEVNPSPAAVTHWNTRADTPAGLLLLLLLEVEVTPSFSSCTRSLQQVSLTIHRLLRRTDMCFYKKRRGMKTLHTSLYCHFIQGHPKLYYRFHFCVYTVSSSSSIFSKIQLLGLLMLMNIHFFYIGYNLLIIIKE